MDIDDKKPVIIGLLVTATVIFVFLVARANLNKKPPANNQAIKPTTNILSRTNRTTPPYFLTNGKTELLLLPKETVAALNDTLTIDLWLKNLSGEMVATDLILEFDPTMLELQKVKNVDNQYLNPRQLVKDNQLILSFVRKVNPGSISPTGYAKSLSLGSLVFKTLKSGETSLIPVLKAEEKTSLVFINNQNTNQLSTAGSVKISIR